MIRRTRWTRRSSSLPAGLAAAVLVLAGCGSDEPDDVPPPTAEEPGEPGGDGGAEPVEVGATVETEPVPSEGDAADDPAVWVNPQDPAASVIVGTDKQSGLVVYDLAGRELQHLPVGEVNNVDLRPVPGGGALVVAGNRSDDSLGVYELDPTTRQLSDVAARTLEVGVEVYGSCLHRSAATGRLHAFVTAKSGEVEQWELVEGPGGVDGELVRSFALGSQIEGCVADDERGDLYIGEEDVGIWRYAAEPDGGDEGTLLAEVSDSGPLVADVEGLAVVRQPDGAAYLIASSQGDSTFAVYLLDEDLEFVRSVRVVGDGAIDGVEDTDGLEAEPAPLGPGFPSGVLVVQDGADDEGNQNFKLVPLERVLPG